MSGHDRFKPEEVREKAEDRAILVGVDRGGRSWSLEESLAELERLADTAGALIVGTVVQKMHSPDSRTFVGKGKAEEIGELARATNATTVVFDDDLTPSQQANLEDVVGPDARVLDRTALILEIFALHAVSREGKLQVDLAQLEYVLPRLRGMWGHLMAERLGGGRGTRFGAGESQLESDRRLTRHRISELKLELQHVSDERSIQRKARVRSSIYRISLVGYTNAGKSTLLNALTGANVLVADQLFATLDATTRTLELPEGRKVTLTDTVGFINKLPHALVEAFKSTLDETREADLLLHVVDASGLQVREQMDAVSVVLGEIGVADKPQLVVYNKTDLLSDEARSALTAKNPNALLVSAVDGEGLERLRERIAAEAARGSRTLSLLVPYEHGEIVALAHEQAQVISEEHTAEGTRVTVRVSAELTPRFEAFVERAGE